MYFRKMKSKQELYESIMKSVAKTVKKVLSESEISNDTDDINTKIINDYIGKKKETKLGMKEAKASFSNIFVKAYNNEHRITDGKTITINKSVAIITDLEGNEEKYVTLTRNKGTNSASTAFAVHLEQITDYDGIIFMDREKNDVYLVNKETCEMLFERPTTRLIRQTGLIKPITVRSKENADYGLVLLVEIKMHADEKFLNIH